MGLSDIISIGILSFVYGTIFKVTNFKEYVIYLGIGLLTWNCISTSISSAPSIFDKNKTQILNTNVTPLFFSIQEWSFTIQNLMQALAMVILILSVFKYNLIFNLIIFGLFPLFNIFIFIYWFPLLISLVGTRFRDLTQLIPVALRLIFLTSPILYNKDSLGQIKWISNLNPVYLLIDNFRSSLIAGNFFLLDNLSMFLLNLFGLYFSLYVYLKLKRALPFYL